MLSRGPDAVHRIDKEFGANPIEVVVARDFECTDRDWVRDVRAEGIETVKDWSVDVARSRTPLRGLPAARLAPAARNVGSTKDIEPGVKLPVVGVIDCKEMHVGKLLAFSMPTHRFLNLAECY